MLKLYPPGPRHPTYRVRGTYLGTSVDRATGTTEKSVAQKLLKRWKEDIERGAYAKPEGPTWATAALSYIQGGGEEYFIDKLTDYFQHKLLESFTQSDIDAAAHALYPDSLASTRNRAVYTPVMAVLRKAGYPHLRLPSGGYAAIQRPKGAQGVARNVWLRQEQAFALIETALACDRRFAVFLMVLLYTGLRHAEALGIREVNLDLHHGFLYVGITKNGEPRGVHLPPHLVDELRMLPPREDGSLFAAYRWYHLREIAERAHVHIPEGVAFHIFRHTWAKWMRMYGGLDTSALIATGAWKSRSAVARYEHIEQTEEARKADLLPTRGAA